MRAIQQQAPGRLATVLLALAGGVIAQAASAQSFVGVGAASCGTLNAAWETTVPLAVPVAAGQTLVVAVATDSADTTGIRVLDTAQSPLRALGGRRDRERDGAITLMAGPAVSALSAGSNLTVRATLASAGAAVCTTVLVYDGILVESRDQRASAREVGTAAPYAIQLDHPADMQRRLLVGAFAASATPGAVTPASGVQATATTCAAGGSPCLTVLHTLAVPLTPSPDVLSASTANAVDWQGTGAVLAALRIFGDGFE